MDLQLHRSTRYDISVGNFPLNHDCILKVEFYNGVGIKYQYFTCRCQDSSLISDILSKVLPIKKVSFCPVDLCTDFF